MFKLQYIKVKWDGSWRENTMLNLPYYTLGKTYATTVNISFYVNFAKGVSFTYFKTTFWVASNLRYCSGDSEAL